MLDDVVDTLFVPHDPPPYCTRRLLFLQAQTFFSRRDPASSRWITAGLLECVFGGSCPGSSPLFRSIFDLLKFLVGRSRGSDS